MYKKGRGRQPGGKLSCMRTPESPPPPCPLATPKYIQLFILTCQCSHDQGNGVERPLTNPQITMRSGTRGSSPLALTIGINFSSFVATENFYNYRHQEYIMSLIVWSLCTTLQELRQLIPNMREEKGYIYTSFWDFWEDFLR